MMEDFGAERGWAFVVSHPFAMKLREDGAPEDDADMRKKTDPYGMTNKRTDNANGKSEMRRFFAPLRMTALVSVSLQGA